jgi:hypothetical protein
MKNFKLILIALLSIYPNPLPIKMILSYFTQQVVAGSQHIFSKVEMSNYIYSVIKRGLNPQIEARP